MASKGAENLMASGWTWSQISARAILETRLSDGAFRLLTYLCWRMNKADGMSWPSHASVVEDMGIKSAQTVRNRCKELEGLGWLKVHPREGQSNLYEVTIPQNRLEQTAPPSSSIDPPRPTNLTPTPQTSLTLTKGSLTKEEEQEGDPSPPPNPKTEQSLSAFSEAATGWEEMKRCSLNSFDRENLAGASERYGDELLLAAIKETNRQGVNSWSYVEAILENWAQEKIPRVVRYTDPDTGKIKVKEVGHPTEKPSPTSWYNSFTGQVEHL